MAATETVAMSAASPRTSPGATWWRLASAGVDAAAVFEGLAPGTYEVGASAVVAVTVLASLTLLPALLGFAGERVERTRWRGLIAAGLVAIALIGVGLGIDALMVGLPLAVVVILAGLVLAPLKREVPRKPPKPIRETTAYRWSRVIQRRPWTAAVGGTLVLLLMAAPVLSLHMGFSDEGNFPEDSTTRQAYDLLADGFGAGFNGPAEGKWEQ